MGLVSPGIWGCGGGGVGGGDGQSGADSWIGSSCPILALCFPYVMGLIMMIGLEKELYAIIFTLEPPHLSLLPLLRPPLSPALTGESRAELSAQCGDSGWGAAPGRQG